MRVRHRLGNCVRHEGLDIPTGASQALASGSVALMSAKRGLFLAPFDELVDPNTLKARGCLFAGIGCKSQLWKKVDGAAD